MKIFTDEFNEIIKLMIKNGHKKITIRLYPEDNYFNLESEWRLNDKEISKS